MCSRKLVFFFLCLISLFVLNGCSQQHAMVSSNYPYSSSFNEAKYTYLLPQKVNYGNEKVILIDPKIFAWGAYDAQGHLVRGGIANAGGSYCEDIGRGCRTTVGRFRIYSMGDSSCYSHIYPKPEGGALMPYCMFFNGGQSLHGSPDHMLGDANISHGCVHMRIPDAEWLRNDFASIGTKVVVLSY